MYDLAMDGMENKLLKRTNGSNLLMLSDWNGVRSMLKMDHLACFTPAMLALGALHRLACLCCRVGERPPLCVKLPCDWCVARSDGSVLESKKWQHMKEAKAMTYSCWQMYERQPTGLSPEYVDYKDLTDPVPGKRVSSAASRRFDAVCTFVAAARAAVQCRVADCRRVIWRCLVPRSRTMPYARRWWSPCFTCTK